MEELSRQRRCPCWQCQEVPAGKRVEAHGSSTEQAAGLSCMICKKKKGGGEVVGQQLGLGPWGRQGGQRYLWGAFSVSGHFLTEAKIRKLQSRKLW